jgi:hypothetical protein
MRAEKSGNIKQRMGLLERRVLPGLIALCLGCASGPSIPGGSFKNTVGAEGGAGADDATPNPSPGSPPASDDSGAVTADDATGPVPTPTPGGDDASAPAEGGSTPILPPITFPDAGGLPPPPPPSGDGGANSCTSKICIDPVFDCPLQGCFNGCTNFHCM